MKLNPGAFCLAVLYLLPAVAQSRRLGGKRVKLGRNEYFEVLEADELDAFGLTLDQEESVEFWIRHLQASSSLTVLPTAPPTVVQPLPPSTSSPTVMAMPPPPAPPTPPPTQAQPQPQPTPPPTEPQPQPTPSAIMPTPPPTVPQPQPTPPPIMSTPPPTVPQPQPTPPPTITPRQPTQAPSGAIDRCDAVTCTDPIEGCDPLDGQCKPIDAAVPCVAVIDESSQPASYITNQWNTFRTQYPDRPFCLLRPISDSASDQLFVPPAFLSDNRTTYANVSRDILGNRSIIPGISDWFNICGLGIYSGSDIQYIGKFLDESRSLTLETVEASNNLFLANVRNANLEIMEVFSGLEDWITPFLTTLVPVRRTALRRSLSKP